MLWEGSLLSAGRGSTSATLLVVCKDTETVMGLKDRLFLQGFIVMLSEGYCRLDFAVESVWTVIPLSRVELVVMWFRQFNDCGFVSLQRLLGSE